MNNEYQYCGFLDVLGFKKILDDWDRAIEYYQRLVMNVLPNTSKAQSTISTAISGANVDWRIFSDSIILTSADALRLIQFAISLQYYSFYSGYWTRGCIAYGRHFAVQSEQNYFVVSQALRDAYIGETILAKHARVVIHPNTLGRIEDELFARGRTELFPQESNFIIQSEDNLWFVNPFLWRPDGDLAIFASAINSRLKEYSDSEFLDKYLWVGDLHNMLTAMGHLHRHIDEYYEKRPSYLDSLKQLCSWNEVAERELVHTWKYTYSFYVFFIAQVPALRLSSRSIIVHKENSPYKNTFWENIRLWPFK
ncbi:MAG: hypothetical protein Q8O86_02635 [Dehalococcoidia bacterium]|nr:hypothetical protein [Dehalococcoidia bacterium]